jgi:hypothetical protein
VRSLIYMGFPVDIIERIAAANGDASLAAPVVVTTALWNQSQELPSASLSIVISAAPSAVDSDPATIFVRPSWTEEGSNSTPLDHTADRAGEFGLFGERIPREPLRTITLGVRLRTAVRRRNWFSRSSGRTSNLNGNHAAISTSRAAQLDDVPLRTICRSLNGSGVS